MRSFFNFFVDIARGLILYDFWIDKYTSFFLLISTVINASRSFSSSFSPIFLAGAIHSLVRKTHGFQTTSLVLFGNTVGELSPPQFLFLWASALGTAQILKSINSTIIAVIQTRLNDDMIQNKFLEKTHHLGIEYLEEHLNPSDTANIIMRSTEETSGLLSKVVNEMIPLFFTSVLSITL